MQLAQRLYEGVDLGGETVGLITYMRTDGVAISGEAIAAARQLIGKDFGAKYVPDAPRVYSSPAKNAQEAHEAIRPTDLARKPADIAAHLDRDQRRLYELIWKRTLASQMASALLEQVTVDITDLAAKLRLRATGQVVLFDGFLTLYQEDRDDAADEDDAGARLPQMREARGAGPRRGRAEPALHPAAAALYRGEPRQKARGARHRPAFDLCLDPPGAAGPRLCPARQAAFSARGPRPAGHRVSDQFLRALRRI